MTDSFLVKDEAALQLHHDASFVLLCAERARENDCADGLAEMMENLGRSIVDAFWKRIYTISHFCEDDHLKIKLEKGLRVIIVKEAADINPTALWMSRRFELN